VKIAILGAMPEEIEPILEKLDNISKVDYAKNSYYKGQYKGVDVVVAYSKIGCVFSSLTATLLIEHFKCDRLLFSGVAGAISEDLKVGDLVVATKLCKHDLDLTAFGHPAGYVPEGNVFIYSNNDLVNLAKEIAKQKQIELKEGIIATGDQFVASSEVKQKIKETFNADALEMEGYPVAVVCDALNVPFVVLRAISDSANDSAHVDFDEFLEKSAKQSAEFILAMVEELGKK
jgi:adenosylhomocysteine/aminodeoxyfutalosine nucleosidase